MPQVAGLDPSRFAVVCVRRGRTTGEKSAGDVHESASRRRAGPRLHRSVTGLHSVTLSPESTRAGMRFALSALEPGMAPGHETGNPMLSADAPDWPGIP